MGRLGLLAVVSFLALAGCAAPPAVEPDEQPAAQDLQVYAIRVEPFTNAVDWHGRLEPRACDPINASPCRYPLTGMSSLGNPVGFDVAPQDDVFQESRGLFWRVALNATWHSETVERPITMSWSTIFEDGSVSREIGNKTATKAVDFPLRDVFLEPGETGIRLRVDLGDEYPFAIGKGIEFHVQGIVQAFLPASAPVLLS